MPTLDSDSSLSSIPGTLTRQTKAVKPRKPLWRGKYTPKKKKAVVGQEKASMRGASIDTLDRHFSKKIRERDCPDGYGKCITCGRTKPYAEMDCGHYLGRQYWATRFDPMNAAAQCRFDNRFNEGMKAQFRAALVLKYGEVAISKMETLHKKGRKPTAIEAKLILERIKAL